MLTIMWERPGHYLKNWEFMRIRSLFSPRIMERRVVDKFSMPECVAKKGVNMMEGIACLSLCIGQTAVWIN